VIAAALPPQVVLASSGHILWHFWQGAMPLSNFINLARPPSVVRA